MYNFNEKVTTELYEKYSEFKMLSSGNTSTSKEFYDETLYDLIKSNIKNKNKNKNKNLNICDLGCGTGMKLKSLLDMGCRNLYGCDINADAEDSPRIVRQGLFDFLKYNSIKFDIIILNDVMEHLSFEQVIELFELCKANMSKGAILYIKVPNGASPYFGLYQYGDFTHKLIFNQYSFLQLQSMTDATLKCCMQEKLSIRKFKGIKKIAVTVLYKIALVRYKYISYLIFRTDVIMTPNIIAMFQFNEQ